VFLDPQRFTQILQNLAGNALDALAAGGWVKVAARLEPEGLRVTIADNGPGMDAKTLEEVQQPFVTTRARGTGLGIPLARRFVEAHGGRLVLRSTPGEGTEATVTFPRRPPGGEEKS
jgi:signal transduction histidine kinase